MGYFDGTTPNLEWKTILESNRVSSNGDSVQSFPNLNSLTQHHQIGHDIGGESGGDKSGYSVSLNNDSTAVAGAEGNDGNTGHVRIYQWKLFTSDDEGMYHYTSRYRGPADSSAGIAEQLLPIIITADTSTPPVVGFYYWTQLGQDIDGEETEELSGTSISLSGGMLAQS